jgi:hypothetical protein
MFSAKYGLFPLLAAITLGIIGRTGGELAMADEPPQISAKAPSDAESLDVRYARAHLELAKLDLRRAREIFSRYPQAMTVRTIENLEKHIAIDEEQLKQAKKTPDGSLHRIHVRGAEVALELAQADLKRKRMVFEKMPSTMAQLDVERAAAVAKVAMLNLERTKAQQASLSSLSYLQWQIETLRNDLLELRIQVETKGTR